MKSAFGWKWITQRQGPPIPPPGWAIYDNAIKDVDIWINDAAVPLPPEFESLDVNDINTIIVRNDTPPNDTLSVRWHQTAIDGKVFEVFVRR